MILLLNPQTVVTAHMFSVEGMGRYRVVQSHTHWVEYTVTLVIAWSDTGICADGIHLIADCLLQSAADGTYRPMYITHSTFLGKSFTADGPHVCNNLPSYNGTSARDK